MRCPRLARRGLGTGPLKLSSIGKVGPLPESSPASFRVTMFLFFFNQFRIIFSRSPCALGKRFRLLRQLFFFYC